MTVNWDKLNEELAAAWPKPEPTLLQNARAAVDLCNPNAPTLIAIAQAEALTRIAEVLETMLEQGADGAA